MLLNSDRFSIAMGQLELDPISLICRGYMRVIINVIG